MFLFCNTSLNSNSSANKFSLPIYAENYFFPFDLQWHFEQLGFHFLGTLTWLGYYKGITEFIWQFFFFKKLRSTGICYIIMTIIMVYFQ